MTDEWSWKKWFSGFISGQRLGKTIALMIQMVIILFFFSMVALGILWVKQKFFPKYEPTPDVITAETANIDKSSKQVTNTFLPFSGWFGSSGKVRNYE